MGRALRLEPLEERTLLVAISFGPAQLIADVPGSGLRDAAAADVDSDGDVDVLTSSATIGHGTRWHENDGSENFTPHDVSGNASFNVAGADLDGDLDVDLVTWELVGFNGEFARYENDGSETFTRHLIATTGTTGPVDVFLVDVDADLDLDVLASGFFEGEIVWYENPTYAEHVVATPGYLSIFPVDIDGDGDLDIAAADSSGDKAAWYENDGAQNFTEHEIASPAASPSDAHAADVDGDGDVDLATAGSELRWYENDGSENFTPHTVATTAAPGRVAAVDLDGDADVDLLSLQDDKIAWYENDGSENFTERPITNDVDYGYDPVFPVDLDSDGDLDVVAQFRYDGQTVWYENIPNEPPPADPLEANDTQATATILGSLPKITLRDLSIHDADDVDYYKYTAQDTGKLIVNALFNTALGNLALHVRDALGNLVATGSGSNVLPGLDVAHLVIPVVTQEEYWIEVLGVGGDTNRYALEIENFAAPVPDSVVLDPMDDLGWSNSDNLTCEDEARIFIEADLAEFAAEGIDVLTPTEVTDQEAGAAVEVFVNGASVGYATPIPGTNNTLFQFTFEPGDLSTTFIPACGGGGLNFVKAAVRIFDGQRDELGDPQPASGRTSLSQPLLLTLDTTAPSASTPDLLASSDTGVFDDDNVTNKDRPAFTGVAEAGAIVRIYANGLLVGEGMVGKDASDGTPGDCLGVWEITVEPLDDGIYDITTEVDDPACNLSGRSEALTIEIDTTPPNTPFLDLVATDDSGRSDEDNITNVATPQMQSVVADPDGPDGHLFPAENVMYRIFDRFDAEPETLRVDSFVTLAGLTTNGAFANTVDLRLKAEPPENANDGLHNLKLEVEDRAGNLSHDFLLEILLDRIAPPKFFGQPDVISTTDGLHPESDTGVEGIPATFSDRITSDTTPRLFGTAEANALLRLYVDLNGNLQVDPDDVFIGETVAVPLDGSSIFPHGYWELTSSVDMNDPQAMPSPLSFDGLRTILLAAQDPAGNFEDPESLDIFIDTHGPQITGVSIGDEPDFDLLDPKPSAGPTPPVDSLLIDVRDLPSRVTNWVYDALARNAVDGNPAENPGHYRLEGDAHGIIPIQDVTVTNLALAPNTPGTVLAAPAPTATTFRAGSAGLSSVDGAYNGLLLRFTAGALAGEERVVETYTGAGNTFTFDIPFSGAPAAGDAFEIISPAQATIELEFAEPLPDDRYTLTISDAIVDPAGNALDGESNAIEPQESPQFPSGDGQPGGDFVARFTVDSRAELGAWAAGSVYLDTNGNFLFDPENPDYTNRDVVHTLGFTTDVVFAGNFVQSATGTADGFDKLAAYGRANGQYRWLVDFDNDGVPDETFSEPAGFRNIGLPIAANVDLTDPEDPDDEGLLNGDEVGLFTGSIWRFDTNHDFLLFDETPISSQLVGYPIAGDFDGDGLDDLATWNVNSNSFFLSLSGDGGGVNSAIASGQVVQTRSFRLGSGYAFIGVRERPVAGDMDGDGIDDLGLWVADRSGMTPEEGAEWYFLISGGSSIVTRLATDPLNPAGFVVEFKPVPFGNDLFARFGDEFAMPVVGNFDPPVSGRAQQSDEDAVDDAGQGEDTPGSEETDPPPKQISLVGTSGDDVFRFMPGPTPDSWIVDLNGARQQIDGVPIAVEFDGLDGHDVVRITGTAGSDVAELRPGRVVLTGKGLSVTAVGAELITVDGGGGNDNAHLYDSLGDDQFRAAPDWAKLYGEGFFNRVLGFSSVEAHATLGGKDAAVFYDSSGDDTFEATPDYGRLYGKGFDNRAESFRYVHGRADNGGSDVARLYDSEGRDVFKAAPGWAKLYGDGFYSRVVGFATVQAFATFGGDDGAVFFDSPGDDTFEATPEYGRLYGEGFDNRAESFRYVHGCARNGGHDVALLYDSEGPDVLKAKPEWARLYGEGFYTRAAGFSEVQAFATQGDDVARLWDSPDNDLFVATPEYARLSGNGFSNQATGFRRVQADATAGGIDTANLVDSNGDDTLVATPDRAVLRGDRFCNVAVSFRHVNAYSSLGDGDRAYLHDSALADYLQAREDWARLSNDDPQAGFSIAAAGFEYLEARSSNDEDTAEIDAEALDWLVAVGWQ